MNLDGYLHLFEIKPCTVTSDNQRKWKNCVSDRGKHWKTVFAVFRCFFIFTMFCFASVFFFFLWRGRKHLHALPSEQLHAKVAGTCSKQLWFIILSLILFYTWLYNRPVLQILSFPSLCYVIIVFVSNHWKVFFCFKTFYFTKIFGRWPHKTFCCSEKGTPLLLIIRFNRFFSQKLGFTVLQEYLLYCGLLAETGERRSNIILKAQEMV